jgi:hypothetical protein
MGQDGSKTQVEGWIIVPTVNSCQWESIAKLRIMPKWATRGTIHIRLTTGRELGKKIKWVKEDWKCFETIASQQIVFKALE